MKKNYVKSNVCQIDDLTCFGCCGNNYKTKDEVLIGIKKNTKEFEDWISLEKPVKDFLRRMRFVRDCGVCFSVIEKDGKVFCPGHPELNNGNDLREGHCDIHYLCKTAYFYKEWDDKKKEKFIKFIKSKNLEWYEFSIGMDNDSLLKEFEDDKKYF